MYVYVFCSLLKYTRIFSMWNNNSNSSSTTSRSFQRKLLKSQWWRKALKFASKKGDLAEFSVRMHVSTVWVLRGNMNNVCNSRLTPNKQRRINSNELVYLHPLSSSAKHISLIRMYIHLKPARAQRAGEKIIITVSYTYMMQKQTHSKHHLSVIIVQRDYSWKDTFYFILFSFFRKWKREIESENKPGIQKWQWDRETQKLCCEQHAVS